MIPPVLNARSVTFAYEPGQPVLRDLSLAVTEGAVLALLGANGSGKSTLLKVLAGTLQPQSGYAALRGVPLSSLSRRAIARQIAVVQQGESSTGSFTVRELVAFGRHPWQGRFAPESGGDRAAVAEALEAVGLAPLAERRGEALSGGERQRLRVAMALAQEPSVMLLDEPTTFLDIRHQVELLDLLTGEGRRGRTIVMVLHDLNLAAAYADRLACLAGGQVACAGSPAEVLTAETIAAVYGVDAVVTHGANGRPHVVVRANSRRPVGDGPHVHLVGGGGSAANLLADLAGRGFRVTLGVVNEGDLDAAIAEDWRIAAVTVPPASPVSPESAESCLTLMREAEAVIVANAPFGPGNVENLRLALQARRAGRPVLLVAEDEIIARDFTGGEAMGLVRELLAAGAESVPREQLVAERLGEMILREC